eukprot:scaffold4284_cov113-Isochrysis_galbana.AAC.4
MGATTGAPPSRRLLASPPKRRPVLVATRARAIERTGSRKKRGVRIGLPQRARRLPTPPRPIPATPLQSRPPRSPRPSSWPATMTGATMTGATMTGATMTGATMTGRCPPREAIGGARAAPPGMRRGSAPASGLGRRGCETAGASGASPAPPRPRRTPVARTRGHAPTPPARV